MNAAVDWKQILVGRIRAIQAAHPEAHEALKNWGRWSRDLNGVFPTLAGPGIWNLADTDKFDDFGDEQPRPRLRLVDQAKSERLEEPKADERSAKQLDELIHKPAFPAIWRKVLRAAYVTAESPEYQFPALSTTSEDDFCMFLDGVLAHVQGS
jgi:hypothetical protein